MMKKATTISITGGKGGVGKTSIALKLGMTLGELNKKVLLVDCDYNLSNTLLKLGLPVCEDFYGPVSSRKDLDGCLHRLGNFHLLPGLNGNLELFDKGGFSFDILVKDII